MTGWLPSCPPCAPAPQDRDPRRGDLICTSAGPSCSTHDLTPARHHDVIDAAARAEVELLADKGYQGAGGTLRSPHKGRKVTNSNAPTIA